MAKLLHMPEVAANATHAAIQNWTLNEGDSIAIGDCIAEIETEKALVELAAEEEAILGKILVEAGKEVEVGAPIGVLFAKGETNVDIGALLAGHAPKSAANDVAQLPQSKTEALPSGNAVKENSERVFASPLARRLAKARGIELSAVSGTGPNGRIVKRDVESAQSAGSQECVDEASRLPVKSSSLFTEIPHSSMRKTIARRLTESKTTVPHFYLDVECRMERLLALREQVNQITPKKVSINDFIVKAVAAALKQVPGMNVSWTDDALRQYNHADVCVAVSTETGLITPVIREVDSKGLAQINTEIFDLAERARAGRLQPAEYQGGSFTISNLGMFGVEKFSAIINPPQSAILAVGAVLKKPVVEDDALTVGTVLQCTLSVDHRAVDGALAAQWLAVFKRLIENPLGMLI